MAFVFQLNELKFLLQMDAKQLVTVFRCIFFPFSVLPFNEMDSNSKLRILTTRRIVIAIKPNRNHICKFFAVQADFFPFARSFLFRYIFLSLLSRSTAELMPFLFLNHIACKFSRKSEIRHQFQCVANVPISILFSHT